MSGARSGAPSGTKPAGPATPATVHVTVNGTPRELTTGTTVAALMPSLGIAAVRCAVEINRQIVPRSTHGSHVLADGDTIELVGFVGGG